MAREFDDDERPSRGAGGRTVVRDRTVEKKIISPRAVNTYRTFVIGGSIWLTAVTFILLSGIWTFTNAPSDIYLKVITMIIGGLNILFSWLFPTGDNS